MMQVSEGSWLEAQRFCRRLVTCLFHGSDILSAQPNLAADSSQCIAHAKPMGRLDGRSQNLANFSLGAAPMQGRLGAQGTMNLIRDIPDSQNGHHPSLSSLG